MQNFVLQKIYSQALLLDYMKSNLNVKYRLKRDSMDFSSIYVTFLSMYVSTSTKGCRKCFDKIFLFTISAWLYTLILQGNWKKETNNKGLQKYKVSEKRVFLSLSLYLLNCFIFPNCYSLYFLPKLKLYTPRSLICPNLQRRKLNDRKLTGPKHARPVHWLVETYSDQRKIMDVTRIPTC